MHFSTLICDITDGIAWIRLNRPERANALGPAFWEEFPQLLQWLDRQGEVRVAIIAGEGKHFCSGADIELLRSLHRIAEQPGCPAEAREKLRLEVLRLQDGLTAIERLRVPVIAAVHGACIGAGLDLIAACDLRYAMADARFCVKEVDLGIVADVGTLQRLRHVIGLPALTELSFTAETFDASRAMALGLISDIFESREAMVSAVNRKAALIAEKSAVTIRGLKHNLLYARDHSVAEGLQYVATWNSFALLSNDGKKALDEARHR